MGFYKRSLKRDKKGEYFSRKDAAITEDFNVKNLNIIKAIVEGGYDYIIIDMCNNPHRFWQDDYMGYDVFYTVLSEDRRIFLSYHGIKREFNSLFGVLGSFLTDPDRPNLWVDKGTVQIDVDIDPGRYDHLTNKYYIKNGG